MAHEQLTPLNQRSKEEARRIQSKGGRTVTPKQCRAAKLRELAKKAKFSDKDVDWVVEKLLDSDADILDQAKFLETNKNKFEKKDYAKLRGDLHKMIYGTKTRNYNQNLNVNVHVDLSNEEVDKEIERITKL